MSVTPLHCKKCQVDSSFERVAPFQSGDTQALYAVAWRCPSCDEVAVDVCPIGPIVPTPTSCLNCGASYLDGKSDSKCSGCGMKKSEAIEFLGVDQPSEDTVSVARAHFERGLYRRGFAELNQLLLRDPASTDAWGEKAMFLQALGYYAASCIPLERARATGGPARLLISWGVALQETGQHREAVTKYR